MSQPAERKSSSILFIVPYPVGEAPSQRFRFEQYFLILKKNGFSFKVVSFFNSQKWQLFYDSGKVLSKAWTLISGSVNRAICLFSVHRYDFIFVHREAAPLGPPVFEWMIAKILRKKIIYDYDDAIWLTDRKNESWLMRSAKFRCKVAMICRWSYKISCGNEYLAGYARKQNSAVFYNPTTIDTHQWHNPDRYSRIVTDDSITIGWTGSHSTLKYLHEIDDVLARILNENRNVKIVIIADQRPQLPYAFEFVRWNVDTEIEDLLQFDIGIMPLPNDEWSKGKCGFKALQYMAMKIPVVASPVGVNINIVTTGRDGFLPTDSTEWYQNLTALIQNRELRSRMGKYGRETVIKNFSVDSNAVNFLNLFS